MNVPNKLITANDSCIYFLSSRYLNELLLKQPVNGNISCYLSLADVHEELRTENDYIISLERELDTDRLQMFINKYMCKSCFK